MSKNEIEGAACAIVLETEQSFNTFNNMSVSTQSERDIIDKETAKKIKS